MTVVTRFAPSPTGFLHIGGARTALFNWLFARHHGGKYLLRIEDTDRARSTQDAVDAILDGLAWLGLGPDEPPVSQASRAERHAEVARTLLDMGKAYLCFATEEELQAMRDAARAEGRPVRYDGRWRDRNPAEAPPGVKPVVRLKAPREGETVIRDLVQGEVRVQNSQLDDLVLLRSDGTPTYMLAVVVDDHDTGITHVIRGDDHLTNAARQRAIYDALGWTAPDFAHIPLIHGPDGTRLSKRHGALGVDAYRDLGFLPEAVTNYLARLGWAHGDDEIFSTDQAIAWFDLDAVGRSAARFDFVKLESLNAHYLRAAEDARLVCLLAPSFERTLGRPLREIERKRLQHAMPGLKERAKTLIELADNSMFLIIPPGEDIDPKAARHLTPETRRLLHALRGALSSTDDWSPVALEETVREFADAKAIKLGAVAQPLRAALTGRSVSPGIFDVLAALGREESLERIAAQETS